MHYKDLPRARMQPGKTISLAGSKSLTNRWLMLQRFFPQITLENAATAQDSEVLKKAFSSDSEIIDIHHAGTAMRFLAAYYATLTGSHKILRGSQRMHQRPIAPLVEALRQLGATINYLEKDGFPPLEIFGSRPQTSEIAIEAGTSSQFISAILLSAGNFPGEITLNLKGKITSLPYLEMTLAMLQRVGFGVDFSQNKIHIWREQPAVGFLEIQMIESDWSSASYFYSAVALGGQEITLEKFETPSLQGDSAVAGIYRECFGIETVFKQGQQILLKPGRETFTEKIDLDLNATPDLAQTLCVTAAAHQRHFRFTGLHTLKIKETDRLAAMQQELEKVGCLTRLTEDSIESVKYFQPQDNPAIATWQDHRMALAFAPYQFVAGLRIENPEVVEKSFPEFWQKWDTLTLI